MMTALYPLSSIIPGLPALQFHIAPPLSNKLVAGLLIAAILTALLTFVVMPPYTRSLRKWLYEETE